MDDQTLFRKGMRRLLEIDDRFEVVGEAEDGREAIAIYRRERPDVLVTDIVMPKVGGVELAQTLTDRQPELKVIYMSGYAPELDGRVDKLAEGSRFLKKPFDPDALGRMARDALAH